MERKMKTLIMAAGLGILSLNAYSADWQVSNQGSRVNFISIKKGDIAEVHHFTQVSGQLSDAGAFSLSIPLNSVVTNVEIRDQRMKEILFETAQYPSVELTASLDGQAIDKASVGTIMSMSVDAKVSLHGKTQNLPVMVSVAKVAGDKLMVASEAPLVVNAGDFGLTPGVEKLRELAGLPAISKAVPVSFVLTLMR
ncbi:YceI family protein [Shewanella halotolerans]|nr:YceI family protein [Shewanella halotolerans]